jgi:flavin-dependent dehydrogenase
MRECDVVIIGAGLAGLHAARELSRAGAGVMLVDRKIDLSVGVHTTGIFVRKTFEDFDLPPGTLGKPVSRVVLYSPKLRSVSLNSKKPEFRVGKMGALYNAYLKECIDGGVEFLGGTRFVSLECGEGESFVMLEKNGGRFRVKTKVVIGADGANSRIARELGLDENREWIVGFEKVYRGVPLEGEPVLHCFLDAKLAPGYIAWATNDGDEVHIGVGGYAADFDPRKAVEEFEKRAARSVDLSGAELIETRGGRIPVGGVLRRIANENGLLIGDAAGAVSPLTAGGLDPCLRLSSLAAGVVMERIRTDDPNVLLQYSGSLFRSRFISRLWMRRVIAFFRSNALIELGCAFLRTKPGMLIARHVFFGRGSFPNVDMKVSPKKAEASRNLLC